jgi:tetratricopeptide (TPR) repeat protein
LDYRRKLAEIKNNLGVLLSQREDLAEAEEHMRDALAINHRLYPNNDHPDLTRSLNNLGSLLQKRGDLVGAEKYYREALAMHRRLYPRGHPNLVTSLNRLGVVLQAKGDLAGAEQNYREALAMSRQLYPKGHPSLAESLTNLNQLLSRKAGTPQQRIDRALALARAGEHAQAAAAAEDLVKGNTSNALYYGAACTLATCSAAAKDDAELREKYAARAVALLSELHAEGYFDAAKNVARLKKDADLDPLRQRDDFRKLLTQVEKAP